MLDGLKASGNCDAATQLASHHDHQHDVALADAFQRFAHCSARNIIVELKRLS